MNYDTIKFMNLEGFAYIIKSIDLTKTNNVLSCNLTLKKRDEAVSYTHLLLMRHLYRLQTRLIGL